MSCAPAVAVAVLVLALPVRGQTGPLFGEPALLAAGNDPRAVVVADFDGNGQRDLAVANEEDGTVTVIMGLSGGLFGAATAYRTGEAPRALAQGDLDLDGATDLVTADHGSNTVTVLLGRGDGSFAQPASYPIGKLPNSLAVADVTDDGWLDVVACCMGLPPDPSPTVFVLHGLGGGLLGATPGFFQGLLTWHVAVASLDGDELPDIVTCNAGEDSFTIWLNQEGGHFLAGQVYPLEGPTAALPLDVGADGELDLALANPDSALSLYHGAGDGTFEAPLQFPLAGPASALAAADLNHDDLSDVVATVGREGCLQAQFGQAGGLLSAATPYATGGLPGAVALGDLDEDGWPDGVVALPEADGLALLRNLAPKDPWTDMGFAAPPSGGPVLAGFGTLRPGSPGVISLAQAAPHAPALLVLSTMMGLQPSACGSLLAVPAQRQWVVTTDGTGAFTAVWTSWPASLDLEGFVLQCAVADARVPCGLSLSNALKASVPE